MKTIKNDIILFLVMLCIALIGFNIVNQQFLSKSPVADTPAASSSVSDDLADPTVSVPSSASIAPAQNKVEVGDVEELQVKSMLANRADAWNNRDLDRYMADYREFDSLRVSYNGETEKGWEAVHDFFAAKFVPGMGKQTIDNMKIHMVGDFASIVTADWRLQQENKITTGRLNLVMKKDDAAWKITTENLTEK